jgi:putative glutamine amidotransferase
MKKPVIGITVNEISGNPNSNRLSSAYTAAIKNAGGLPLLIPNEFPVNDIVTLKNVLNGILLTGGGDVNINLFDGQDDPEIGNVSDARDALEIALVRKSREFNWPLFGICRGVQVLNVALGGTLYTHIPAQFQTILKHDTPDSMGRDFLAHKVIIENGSKLFDIIGMTEIKTNSFHHQGIKDLAPTLRVTARASDGLIEAVETNENGFDMIGVQWHPECIQMLPEQQNLFRAFINACTS